MERIARGAYVFVLLSERYLQRPRCMAEFKGLFLDARSQEAEFNKLIMAVVLDDARIGTALERAQVTRFWAAQIKSIRPHLKHLGGEDLKEYQSMKVWHLNVGDILHYVSDRIVPWGYENITRDNYGAIREVLRRNAKP